VPEALRPSQGPGHTGATTLPRPPQHRLQEIQPLADGRRAGCLHCCGGEAAEPLSAGPVGSADRAAVLGAEGLRTRKNECQAYEGQNCRASAATTESYSINLGYTPGHRRGPPRASPSGDRVGAGEWMGKEVCRTQDGPRRAAITSAATSESYAFHAGALPAYYWSQTAAGSSAVAESHCASGSCVAHAAGDTEHRCQTPPEIQGFWRG
jgi:hypothetical protein